jgi:hypothetical protein
VVVVDILSIFFLIILGSPIAGKAIPKFIHATRFGLESIGKEWLPLPLLGNLFHSRVEKM